MASEPAPGQPKKLHPLFTTLKVDQNQNGDEAGLEPELQQGPEQNHDQMFSDTLVQETNPISTLDPRLRAVEGAMNPTAKANAGFVASESMPAEVTTALDMQPTAQHISLAGVQKTRKPDDGPNNGVPQTPQPRRRGRPPKNPKPLPTSSGIASHFVRQNDVISSSPMPMAGYNNDTISIVNERLSATPSSTIDSASATVHPQPPGAAPAENHSAPSQPPTRLLHFNPKTGTIGSPPKPKETAVGETRQGNGVSGKSLPVRSPLVIAYGRDDTASRIRIGVMIDAVMGKKCRIFPLPPPTEAKTTKRGPKPAKQGPPDGKPAISNPPNTQKTVESSTKSTHPFFTGARPKEPASNASSSNTPPTNLTTAKYYTSTPCSPKRPLGLQPWPNSKAPQFGAHNGILRVPGACLPAWPWKGAVHVQPEGEQQVEPKYAHLPPLSLPKRKGNAVEIRFERSIIAQEVKRLKISSVIEEIQNANADDFCLPPPELRLPQRHIESGRKLQAQVAPQLRTNHPGLKSLFDSLQTTLSAFDQYQCESLSWTQKYTPSCAVEVLQSGREPQMLRAWLEALKVLSVDTGPGEPAPPSGTSKKGGVKKKRKKNKLDGFIVSSDDDDDEMGEVSDNEAEWSASGRYGLEKKTVIRTGDLIDKAGREGARLTNAVVISGPHGCGKSAAVYAVAKELEFEIFEINASSRRSGKDVIDKIGDMTRNHLVQHRKQKLSSATALAEDDRTADKSATDADGDDDATDGDTAPGSGGKQAMMSAFFKPKGPPTTKGRKPKQTSEATAAADSSKGTPQEQKQSLILLEEADILYEEDKQFWATVMGLIIQSKRPFVITCNDETLIPLQTLRLHGIFRFTAPPAEAAVDRLLLVAASEGHILQRNAVQALYEARNYDFRASLVDLQFWCQIGVGDQRGGFDWFIQRWPDGVDLDEEQQVKRVISQNTYQEGMGWLDHDVLAAESNDQNNDGRSIVVEEDLVQQAWSNWQLDMGQWQDSLDLGTWASQMNIPTHAKPATPRSRLHLLDSYCQFTDAMSDADAVSSMAFAIENEVPIDATQPELAPKARDDYILGQHLLERTVPAHEYDVLRLPMATAIRCLAKELLHQDMASQATSVSRPDQHGGATDCLNYVDESQVVAGIRAQQTQHQKFVPNQTPEISRIDISLAFDPIAVADSALPGGGYYGSSAPSASYLDPSVFDRNLELIVADVAPFVRGIVAYDGRLQKQRQRLSAFVSEASRAVSPSGTTEGDSDAPPPEATRRPPKRMRTTRAALSALEGGPRSTTRKEKWFQADMNPVLVMRTGGDGWEKIVEAALAEEADKVARAPVAPPADLNSTLAVPAEPALSLEENGVPNGVPNGGSEQDSTAACSRRQDVVMSSP